MMGLRIVFFGAGNISRALIEGLIASGYEKKLICYIDRNKTNSARSKRLGIRKLQIKSLNSKDIIFLAVKPKDALNAYKDICMSIKKPKIISLVAGIKSSKYLSIAENVELIRAMPNTSSRFGKGITAIHNISASGTTNNKVNAIIKKTGIILLISRESQMNDFTGLIGSGPAYFFYLLKVYEKHILKLCDGNNKAKDEIIGNLFEGIALSIKGQNTLDELIDAVASKRGTTEAGLNDFKSSKLSKNFEKGIISAIKRSKEISNEF